MSRRHPDAEPAVCFDFDGTLTKGPWPDGLDANEPMVALARKLAAAGTLIYVDTGRPEDDRPMVAKWLAVHGIACDRIRLGKPRADFYIDDLGLTHDARVLESLIAKGQNADDWLARLAAYEGDDPYTLLCGDVPQNPERTSVDADGFEVVIPFSSGMDSMTLWLHARAEALPYRLLYFDFGQPYAALELAAAAALLAAEGDPTQLEVIRHPVEFAVWAHILCGRNALLLHAAAAVINGWGEVWFGGLGGETPITGGDKSRRFLADTQALLTLEGRDVRLVSPLGVMDKPDVVRWLIARSKLDLLRLSKSCYGLDSNACGRCSVCFRKWAALWENDVDPASFFPDGTDFTAVVERYRGRMRAPDAGGYNLPRAAATLAACDAWEQT